jgi:hypothetical protein
LGQWPDAAQMSTAELTDYLQAAYEQCVAYLPDTANLAAVPVPSRWRLAQLSQARALFRSGVAGSGDQIGQDGLTITVYPMDWTVRNLLRPRTVVTPR